MNTGFFDVTLYLLSGFAETVKIFGVTLLFSLPLGLLICFFTRFAPTPVRWLFRGIVWVVRGTPLMLQLIVVFYGPGLLGFPTPDVKLATYLTFSVNYACYFSEIYRGGIESIPHGQYEACRTLGMTGWETFRYVVLAQVIRRIVPPMGNEIITLVKDTSLARIIGYYEVIFFAQKYIRLEGLLWPLLYTGLFYLLFSGVLTLLLHRTEKKLSYYRI